MALARHSGDHGFDDLAGDPRLERRVEHDARRERAHAAGIGPLVIVEEAFVILRRCQRQDPFAVAHDEERDFWSGQTFFNDDAIARRTELAVAHEGGDRGGGGGAILGDDDAFSSRETVGLQHDAGIRTCPIAQPSAPRSADSQV